MRGGCPERALEADVDVLSRGRWAGSSDDTVPRLRCRIIAGAANNQLADDGVADLLAAAGILWAPDFVVNAGGLINIAEEIGGYDPAAPVGGSSDRGHAGQIFDDAERWEPRR